MTLRASSANKTLSGQLFGFTVRKKFGITVLISIFMLLICPGYVLTDINKYLEYSTGLYEFDNILPDISLIIAMRTCAVAAICCFLNFAFMYSEESGAVYVALPLPRNVLLFSRFFAGVVPILLPVFLCY